MKDKIKMLVMLGLTEKQAYNFCKEIYEKGLNNVTLIVNNNFSQIPLEDTVK